MFLADLLLAMHRLFWLFFFITIRFSVASAQERIPITVSLNDSVNGQVLEGARVLDAGGHVLGITNGYGQAALRLLPGSNRLTISLLGYRNIIKTLEVPASGRMSESFTLSPSATQLTAVRIEDKEGRRNGLARLDPKLVALLPTAGGIEALLKTLPGVSSNNELSSQYNVRGGNFDENLIYVNDVEVYRPFLVRSGQQEGLSFINPDLVAGVQFSAGGFEARYGDKMSSVLDITYRRPRSFGGTATGSLLGGALHLEGASRDARFSWLVGVRQRSNRYLLNSLDTRGDYRPNFVDAQALLQADLTPEWSLSLFGNYTSNTYNFTPEDRTTRFGTVTQVKQLTVYFDGQERNSFLTGLGAFTATYKPAENVKLKFIASGFQSVEEERANVQGQYLIYDVESDLAKQNFGDTTRLTGVGTFLNRSRNNLNARVFSMEHKGVAGQLKWGVRYQHESIVDRLSEWNLIDSSGYTLPYSDKDINLQDVIKEQISLNSNRVMGYVQHGFQWVTGYEANRPGSGSDWSLTYGLRSQFWDLNKQVFLSPRAQLSLKPDWKRDILFRFATGVYNQAPFYRELRGFDGAINRGLRAQTSYHFVLGGDYQFQAWGRPFKFTTEVYYKYLDNLVPYKIENVRLRYFAQNNANGYAAGVDMKLNGEIAKGLESWLSVSLMQTMENIKGDTYLRYLNKSGQEIYPGFSADTVAQVQRIQAGNIPRPSDQRVNVSLFFQDYIPRYPSIKMHMTLMYGTGFPYGPNGLNRYADTLRIDPYRRVDIGFSKQLISEEKPRGPRNPLRYIKSAWISLEVFNLLQIKNTISYFWVKDTDGVQWPIPNYLTNRQVNLKLLVRF